LCQKRSWSNCRSEFELGLDGTEDRGVVGFRKRLNDLQVTGHAEPGRNSHIVVDPQTTLVSERDTEVSDGRAFEIPGDLLAFRRNNRLGVNNVALKLESKRRVALRSSARSNPLQSGD